MSARAFSRFLALFGKKRPKTRLRFLEKSAQKPIKYRKFLYQ
jgi:hypothetical protein